MKNINPLWILLIGVIFFFAGAALGGALGGSVIANSIALIGVVFVLVGVISGIVRGIIFLFSYIAEASEADKASQPYLSEDDIKRNKQLKTFRNDAKQRYMKQLNILLETNKSWRLVKVVYFIVTAILALILLSVYSNDSEAWFGFFMTIILIYPGYLLVRKLFMYISGTGS
jgi:hypothetical protein